jgi:hypothetical protein
MRMMMEDSDECSAPPSVTISPSQRLPDRGARIGEQVGMFQPRGTHSHTRFINLAPDYR